MFGFSFNVACGLGCAVFILLLLHSICLSTAYFYMFYVRVCTCFMLEFVGCVHLFIWISQMLHIVVLTVLMLFFFVVIT